VIYCFTWDSEKTGKPVETLLADAFARLLADEGPAPHYSTPFKEFLEGLASLKGERVLAALEGAYAAAGRKRPSWWGASFWDVCALKECKSEGIGLAEVKAAIAAHDAEVAEFKRLYAQPRIPSQVVTDDPDHVAYRRRIEEAVQLIKSKRETLEEDSAKYVDDPRSKGPNDGLAHLIGELKARRVDLAIVMAFAAVGRSMRGKIHPWYNARRYCVDECVNPALIDAAIAAHDAEFTDILKLCAERSEHTARLRKRDAERAKTPQRIRPPRRRGDYGPDEV
jgi:hypothetical protein